MQDSNVLDTNSVLAWMADPESNHMNSSHSCHMSTEQTIGNGLKIELNMLMMKELLRVLCSA